MPRPPKATRDDVLNDTRQRLLDAAAAEFACEGYAGANINRISTTAGFAKGTIYNHFASKRTLITELIAAIAEQHMAAFQARMATDVSPSAQLRGFFEGGFAYVNRHPNEARVIINAVYGPDPDLKEVVYGAYQPLFDVLINDLIPAGSAQGEFRPVDPDETAALIMTVYLGACSLLAPDGSVWLQPDQVMAFIMHGLRACE